MPVPDSVLRAENNPQHPASPAYWLRELQAQYDHLDVPFHKNTERKLDKQAEYLAALVRQAGHTLAAGICGTTIHGARSWRDEDPIFKACLDMAEDAMSDTLVAEGYRRGVEGVPIIIRDKQGNIIGEERKYSDGLLMKLLQALDSKGRFSKAAANDPASRDEWRKALAQMADNPEAIKLLEQLADLSYGEKSES